MRKQRRDRKQQHLDSKSHYEMMAEKETDEKAKQEFRQKPYQCCNVTEYLARKYDVKGVMQVGN